MTPPLIPRPPVTLPDVIPPELAAVIWGWIATLAAVALWRVLRVLVREIRTLVLTLRHRRTIRATGRPQPEFRP